MKCSIWYNLKNDRMICLFSRQTIQHQSNSSLCPNHWCQRNWSWSVLWRPTNPSRTDTQKRYPFHHRRLECRSRKSRDTWSNRQVWPWSTKWSRAKANRILRRERTGHSKHPLPKMQETTSPESQHQIQTDYNSLQPKTEKLHTVNKNKIRSSVRSNSLQSHGL